MNTRQFGGRRSIGRAAARSQRPLARAAVGLVTIGAFVGAMATSAMASSDLFAPPEEGLTVWETVLLFVITPAAIFGIIALAVMGPSMGKGGRHRPGDALETGPVWIDPNDAAARARRTSAARPSDTVPAEERQGGVSAHW